MGRDRSGVRKVSDSSIEISFTYKGVRCRERIKLQPTPTNLKRAENHRGAILDAIARGTFDYSATFPGSRNVTKFAPTCGVLLSVYLSEWLEVQKEYLKSSTWNDYRKIIRNQLIPAFGGTPIGALSRKQVKEWTDTLTASTKRIGNIISPLRVALADAVEDEIIDVNPLDGWTIKRKKIKAADRKDPIDPFNEEERKAIIASASGQNRNLVRFLFWTGIRTSEACALNWGDVDFVRGYFRVDKALTQHSDQPEETKTAAGTRDIKLLPEALQAIKDQKKHTFLKNEEIFQNPRTGERWEGDQPIRKTMWTRLLKKAGVRYRYPYQTRHSFASMMLMAGESPQWVANQIGHKDWGFTIRTYSRYIPEDAPDAGMKAAKKWGMLSS